jgi:hypothetical protein
MNKRTKSICGLFLCIVLITSFVVIHVEGNGGGRWDRAQTGCGNGCHGPEDLTFTVTVTGLPIEYTPTQAYSVDISVSGGPATTRGGFNLEVTAGTLSTTDVNVQIDAPPTQAAHDNENQRAWNVDWTAPTAGTGDVTFYLAAMAAGDPPNRDGDSWKFYSTIVPEAIPTNTPPTVDLTYPDGGEDWTGGFSHRIWWNMSDAEDTDNTQLRVWINYSVNSGASWNPIATAQNIAGTANPNSYDWNVPSIDSLLTRVNVTVQDTGGLSGYDISLGDFTIDSTPPVVDTTIPLDLAIDISRATNIEITFSEQMDQNSAENAFELRRTDDWTLVSGIFQPWIGNTMILDPTTDLAPKTQYQANVSTVAKDDSNPGNNMASMYSFTFTTLDDMPPEISNVLIDNQPVRTVAAGTIVTLNATIDDTNTGDSNIGGANYTRGQGNWASSVAMNPQDAGFDSPKENATLQIDTAGWPDGVYDLYVYGWDTYPNNNVTSVSFATLVISADTEPPSVSNALINGNPTVTYPMSSIPTLTLTATVDDSATGGSNIAGANYTLGQGNWPGTDMNAADGGFNQPTEDVTIDILPRPTMPGTYFYYVYGWDENLNYNMTSTSFATLTITDDMPPEVLNVLVENQTSVAIQPGTAVTLTGTVDDSNTGNSNIGGANNTTGQGVWATSAAMTPETPLDSPTEDFRQIIDTTGWSPGSYDLYVYGWDVVSNSNITSGAYATLILSADIAPPQIMNVHIDGQPTATYNLSALPPTVNLTATIDDTNTGNSNIGGANYTTPTATSFPGITMDPVNPPFDNPIENVTATITTPTLPGVYNYYVYAWDEIPAYNNLAPYATLVIVDDLPPQISDVLIDGSPSKTYYLSNPPATIDLTAIVDDSVTGGSNISGANYTTPTATSWPGVGMIPIGEIPAIWDDEVVEDVVVTVDITGYVVGTYYFYVYAWDQSGTYNNTAPYATLVMVDDLPPEISNVKVNGLDSVTVLEGTQVTLTATIDDSGTGDSFILGGNYTDGLQTWPGIPMNAADGTFDGPTEDVIITIDTTGWSGSHDIYVYGWDGATPTQNNNVTSTAYATIVIDTPPTLTWTGEADYLSDGLYPESGYTDTIYNYRIKYVDVDNNQPAAGDPKLHIEKGGVEIAGSPFTMSFVSGTYSAGAIYSYSTTLAEGNDYTYYFTASDELGAPATPTEEKDGPVVITSVIEQPPETPTNLRVTTSEDKGELILTWDANDEEDLEGYGIYRSTTSYESSDNGTGYELVTTVDESTTSFVDTGLDDGKTYYYVVTAFDETGNESPYSDEARGRTGSEAPAGSLLWLAWVVGLAVLFVHLILFMLLLRRRRKKAAEAVEEEESSDESKPDQ